MKYNNAGYKVRSFKFGQFNEDLQKYLKQKKNFIKYEISLRGYKFLFNYLDYSYLEEETYLYEKPSAPMTCIFCLKSEHEVTFDTKPHVIPVFLGNRYLLHYEECDKCNAYFSASLEDVLDKYTTVFRTLGQIKNRRKKLNTITSIDGGFSYKFNPVNQAYEMRGERFDDYVRDDGNGNLNISYEIKKHRPSDVFKAFMKIFYGVLPPEHRKNFTILRKWIMDTDPNKVLIKPISVVRSFLPNFNKKPLVVHIMYRDKNFEIEQTDFDYIGLIAFGNIVYEMPIISDTFLENANKLKMNKKPLKFQLKLFPKPMPAVETRKIDLSITEKITDKLEITFTYSERKDL